MARIQGEAALALWTEHNCTARLKHQDLKQPRVPWDISFWPAQLHNFLPLRSKQSPAISCCPSVHTYSTNWSKSVMSQHPLASFGLLHTFKNVRLRIPDPASSFHNAKHHPSHTYPSPLPLLISHCPYCHQSKFYLLEATKSSTSPQHPSRAKCFPVLLSLQPNRWTPTRSCTWHLPKEVVLE